MPSWKELDLGERKVGEVDRRAKSGNGIIKFGVNEVNIGQVTEDAVGKRVVIEKSSRLLGVCLNTKFHTDDYLNTHPITKNNIYLNVGTKSKTEYKKWCRMDFHPQSGDLFAAEIDRIGRNDVGIIDTIRGHDIIVEGVTQDDVGELIEVEAIKKRLAKKVSDNVEIVETLPSMQIDTDTIEEPEKKEQAEQLEETGTDTSEEVISSGEQTVNTETSDSESQSFSRDYQTNSSKIQTVEALREAAEQDAVEQVPEKATTTTNQTTQYTRSERITEYAKARAGGVCEGCEDPAPFISKTGDPYLHAHHVHELSEGGSDTPETVIALCPNCHYRVHHGEDGEDYNQELIHQLADIEDISVESIRSQKYN